MASELNESVAAEIRKRLTQLGQSQLDLCAALHWDKSYLSRRLVGETDFSLSEIEAIAHALDMSEIQLVAAPSPRNERKAG